MYPEQSIHNQAGAGLPVALFVITVLALLVIGMAQLQQSSSNAVSLQIQSQRAFFSAESGAQVAVADVLYGGRSCPASWVLNFTEASLSSCTALLACSAEDASGGAGGGGDTLYTITSRGVCGSGADAAERVLEVRVR
jgi:MSHA biogenesis protein MshP